MNQQRKRPSNWVIGAVLALLFVLIFTITLIGFIKGFEATPPIKKIVAWTTTIIAGAIGSFLIGAAIFDVVTAFIKKRIYRKEPK